MKEVYRPVLLVLGVIIMLPTAVCAGEKMSHVISVDVSVLILNCCKKILVYGAS